MSEQMDLQLDAIAQVKLQNHQKKKKKRKVNSKLQGLLTEKKQIKAKFYSLETYQNTLVGGADTNIYLWDFRNSSTALGVLEEFHTEPITQLKFHPELSTSHKCPVLFSGSEDGSINQFILNDLKSSNQDETLEATINSDQSVRKMGFFGSRNEYLWVLSQVETTSLWDIETAEQIGTFPDVRDNLTTSINKIRTDSSINYLVNCLYHRSSERLFVLAGGISGDAALCHMNKSSIQICAIDEKSGEEKKLEDDEKMKDGSKNTGHTDVIRDCLILGSHLVTCGQDGRICIWSQPSSPSNER